MSSSILFVQFVLLAQVSGSSTYDPPVARHERIDGDSTAGVGVLSDERPAMPSSDPFQPVLPAESDRESPFGAAPSTQPPPTERPAYIPPVDRRNGAGDRLRTPPPVADSFRNARPSQRSAGEGPRTAKYWITELLSEPPEGALPGTSITLADALRSVHGEQRQQQIISTYWQLSRAIANYHVAAQVQRTIDAAAGRIGARANREEAAYAVRLRLDAAKAKLEAVKSQAKLASLITWNDDALPIPASLPHVGTYRTRYEEIFPTGQNQPALRLHFLLPAQAEVIRAHAEMLNVLTADETSEMLDASAFREECAAFLSAVDNYNRNIASYVLLATANGGDGADLVPMLIKVRQDDRNREPANIASQVVPTYATKDDRSDNSGVERSVLIQPGEEPDLVPVEPGSRSDAWRRRQ